MRWKFIEHVSKNMPQHVGNLPVGVFMSVNVLSYDYDPAYQPVCIGRCDHVTEKQEVGGDRRWILLRLLQPLRPEQLSVNRAERHDSGRLCRGSAAHKHAAQRRCLHFITLSAIQYASGLGLKRLAWEQRADKGGHFFSSRCFCCYLHRCRRSSCLLCSVRSVRHDQSRHE